MDRLYYLLFEVASLDLHAELDIVLEDKNLQKQIIEILKERLERGINGDGVTMASLKPYSPSYADLKGSNVVDLRLTGRFYTTFKFFKTKTKFGVVADYDLYGYDFRDVYGDVTGLKSSVKELQSIIGKRLIQHLHDKFDRITSTKNVPRDIKNREPKIVR